MSQEYMMNEEEFEEALSEMSEEFQEAYAGLDDSMSLPEMLEVLEEAKE